MNWFVADGVDVVVIAPHVDDAVGDGGRGVHAVSGRVVPELRAVGGVEGVDVVVKAPHVDDAVGDGGGGSHVAPVVKLHTFAPVVALRA